VGTGSREGKEEPVSLSAVYPHRIRLRGPWECEPQGGPPARRVIMPCRWLEAGLADFHGAARFTRSFGYPGRVDDSEHVWLTCDGCTGCREVRLNGQLLTRESCHDFAFDVSKILSQRNRLEILIQGDTDEAGVWGEVALEIRKDAYLADIHLEPGRLAVHLTGKVFGVAPQPLELYVLVDGRHVDYRTIMPSIDGTPFRIELTAITSSSHMARVELIQISSIWYVVEVPIPRWHSD
jgi:hypothetical protein